MYLSDVCLIVAVLVSIVTIKTDAAAAADECGIRSAAVSSSSRLNDRIVGGHDSIAGSWPWTAEVVEKLIGMRFCGGVLIHPNWVTDLLA